MSGVGLYRTHARRTDQVKVWHSRRCRTLYVQGVIFSVVDIGHEAQTLTCINGVVVTWVVAIDPPGVRFPLNAVEEIASMLFVTLCILYSEHWGT